MEQLGSGALDERLAEFAESVPEDHLCWVTCWPEPDTELRARTVSHSGWMTAMNRFCSIVKEAGKPRLKTLLILTAWSGQRPVDGTTYGELWPGNRYIDAFAMSGYSHSGSRAGLWGQGMAFAAQRGVPWGLPRRAAPIGWTRDGCGHKPTTPLPVPPWPEQEVPPSSAGVHAASGTCCRHQATMPELRTRAARSPQTTIACPARPGCDGMPIFPELIEVERNQSHCSMKVDGQEFPYGISLDGIHACVNDDVPSVTITLPCQRLEIVNDKGSAQQKV